VLLGLEACEHNLLWGNFRTGVMARTSRPSVLMISTISGPRCASRVSRRGPPKIPAGARGISPLSHSRRPARGRLAAKHAEVVDPNGMPVLEDATRQTVSETVSRLLRRDVEGRLSPCMGTAGGERPMIQIQRILCPIDFSPASSAALEHAALAQ
jgi:hypothetical protein